MLSNLAGLSWFTIRGLPLSPQSWPRVKPARRQKKRLHLCLRFLASGFPHHALVCTSFRSSQVH